jgi:hypothetical protein
MKIWRRALKLMLWHRLDVQYQQKQKLWEDCEKRFWKYNTDDAWGWLNRFFHHKFVFSTQVRSWQRILTHVLVLSNIRRHEGLPGGLFPSISCTCTQVTCIIVAPPGNWPFWRIGPRDYRYWPGLLSANRSYWYQGDAFGLFCILRRVFFILFTSWLFEP